MAKMLYTYLVSLTIIEIFIALVYGDINTVGGILTYFDIINNPTSISLTGFFNTLQTTIFAIGLTAIIVGFFVTDSKESKVLGSIAVFFSTILVADMANIILYMKGAYPASPAYYGMLILFGGLMVGFLVAIIDWWRGTD